MERALVSSRPLSVDDASINPSDVHVLQRCSTTTKDPEIKSTSEVKFIQRLTQLHGSTIRDPILRRAVVLYFKRLWNQYGRPMAEFENSRLNARQLIPGLNTRERVNQSDVFAADYFCRHFLHFQGCLTHMQALITHLNTRIGYNFSESAMGEFWSMFRHDIFGFRLFRNVEPPVIQINGVLFSPLSFYQGLLRCRKTLGFTSWAVAAKRGRARWTSLLQLKELLSAGSQRTIKIPQRKVVSMAFDIQNALADIDEETDYRIIEDFLWGKPVVEPHFIALAVLSPSLSHICKVLLSILLTRRMMPRSRVTQTAIDMFTHLRRIEHVMEMFESSSSKLNSVNKCDGLVQSHGEHSYPLS